MLSALLRHLGCKEENFISVSECWKWCSIADCIVNKKWFLNEPKSRIEKLFEELRSGPVNDMGFFDRAGQNKEHLDVNP
jgi:hypothetical protein